jgi:alpha-beta hydrolase superfamily lysophospholipase
MTIAQGHREIFHYLHQKPIPVHYKFAEEVLSLPPAWSLKIDLPTLLFHGTKDTVVPPMGSQNFARARFLISLLASDKNRANVTLRIMDTNHEFLDKLDDIAKV